VNPAAWGFLSAIVVALLALVGTVLNWLGQIDTRRVARQSEERTARHDAAAQTVERASMEFTIMKDTLAAVVEDQQRTRVSLAECVERDTKRARNEKILVEWIRVHHPDEDPPELVPV
jgi:hypothetical protein